MCSATQMEVFFEKMSLAFKSPGVIPHWYIHTPTQAKQTKKLSAIHFKATRNAFTRKTQKYQTPENPQKLTGCTNAVFNLRTKFSDGTAFPRGEQSEEMGEIYPVQLSNYDFLQKYQIKSLLCGAAGKTFIIQKGRCCLELRRGTTRAEESKAWHAIDTAIEQDSGLANSPLASATGARLAKQQHRY